MTLIEIIVPSLMVLVLAWLTLEYSMLLPARKGLAILMYHKLSENRSDSLTISADKFDLQMMYLKEKGYQTITFSELKTLCDAGEKLPKKTIIISFDDAYSSFKELALPLLKKYGFKATLFVPVAYVGKTNIWDQGQDSILPAQTLKQLTIQGDVEIGLHSFLHRNWADLAIEDMEEDLQNCFQSLDFWAIPFVRVLAYPYGGFPKKDEHLKSQMTMLFQRLKMIYAVRIGNRINPFPLQNPYEIKRIDIKGTDSFFIFKIKMKKGRAKRFA